jgi:hypothetical protein
LGKKAFLGEPLETEETLDIGDTGDSDSSGYDDEEVEAEDTDLLNSCTPLPRLALLDSITVVRTC